MIYVFILVINELSTVKLGVNKEKIK